MCDGVGYEGVSCDEVSTLRWSKRKGGTREVSRGGGLCTHLGGTGARWPLGVPLVGRSQRILSYRSASQALPVRPLHGSSQNKRRVGVGTEWWHHKTSFRQCIVLAAAGIPCRSPKGVRWPGREFSQFEFLMHTALCFRGDDRYLAVFTCDECMQVLRPATHQWLVGRGRCWEQAGLLDRTAASRRTARPRMLSAAAARHRF